jgi:hypothetical protein
MSPIEIFNSSLSLLVEQQMYLSLQDAMARHAITLEDQELLRCHELKAKLGAEKIRHFMKVGVSKERWINEHTALLQRVTAYHVKLQEDCNFSGLKECAVPLKAIRALGGTFSLILQSSPEIGKTNGSGTFLVPGTYSSMVRALGFPSRHIDTHTHSRTLFLAI